MNDTLKAVEHLLESGEKNTTSNFTSEEYEKSLQILLEEVDR